MSELNINNTFPNPNLGLIPTSGVKEQIRKTVSYTSNTEWFFFETPFPRLRSTKSAMSIFDFHKSAYNALQIANSGIAYVPAYPDYLLTEETETYISDTRQVPQKIITYNTVKSEPGSLSGEPFGRPRELRPRVREQLFLDPLFRKDIDDPADKLKYYKTEGQWFDNLVQFDLWTKTNYEAEELIEWFEFFLDKYRDMFKELGMQEMHYYRRVRDDTLLKWKNKFTVRSLIYYFRTEKVKIMEIYPIKRVNIKLDVIKGTNEQLYPEQRYIENEQRILNKWLKSGGK